MQDIRRSIFLLTLVLMIIGVVMIYSASGIYAYEKFGESIFFVKRHLLFMFFGFILMLAAMSVDLEKIRTFSRPIMLISIFLLMLVLIPRIGLSVGGARRWFRIGILGFQPSELAKFSLILYIADYLSQKGYKIKDFLSGYLPCMSLIALTCLLVLLEPDLGTAISIVFIGLIIIFIAGGNVKYILTTILLGVPLLYYMIFSVPYRRKRMLIFLNPWQDKAGSGFQIVQSFIALGSGGLFGVGLGQSRQKLFYLPESHTDFIFSIIGEELGFVGAALVVILLGILVVQGMRGFFKEDRPFNKLLIFGITSMIAFESLVNIGVNVGAFPTKGLPLPFISYGGSSLIFHMAGIGLMLNALRDT